MSGNHNSRHIDNLARYVLSFILPVLGETGITIITPILQK